MSHKRTSGSEYVFEYQNLDWISTTVDAIVVEDKWYTPLTTIQDVKAFYLLVEQTNNGATNEALEVELTIDGTVYTETIAAAVSGTPYYIALGAAAVAYSTATVLQMLSLDADQSAPLETKNLQIRVRQTSVVDGVAAQIEVNMVYAQLERT